MILAILRNSIGMSREHQIVRKIYQGNDGPIYLVRNRKGKEMIMKRYLFDPNKDGVEPSILIEAMMLNLVKGRPNLVQMDKIIYDRNDQVDLVIEKMDGELKDLILQELSSEQIRDIMFQILTGLNYLHQNGIIHNDVKPRNILYRQTGKKFEIKVIDFGLAYLVNFPYYRPNKIQTTHHYTPPEYRHYREVGRIGVNADMYSLGIIFNYLSNLESYLENDHRENYDFLFDPLQVNAQDSYQKIGTEGLDLLGKLLELDPEERISSEDALKHPYFQKKKQKGGAIKLQGWEIPRRMSETEFVKRSNQDQFLDLIVEKSKKTTFDVSPKQEIPVYIWNLMYEYFKSMDLKFITLNYGIYLMLKYLSSKRIDPERWETLAFTSLYLSSKFNEYKLKIDLNDYRKFGNKSDVTKLEREIIELFKWNFPLPILITKEVIMYDYFHKIMYDFLLPKRKYDFVPMGNHHVYYYVLELISSLIYFSPKIRNKPKEKVVKALVSILPEPYRSLEHDKDIRYEITDLIRGKRQIFWMERDLIDFLQI